MGGPYGSVIVGFGFAAVACGIALSPLIMGLIVIHHVRKYTSPEFLTKPQFFIWL